MSWRIGEPGYDQYGFLLPPLGNPYPNIFGANVKDLNQARALLPKEKQLVGKNKVIFVVDQSSSIQTFGLTGSVIQHHNDSLRACQAQGMECQTMLFNTSWNPPQPSLPLSRDGWSGNGPTIRYSPSGQTNLLEAMLEVLSQTQLSLNDTLLVLVLTDGQDNLRGPDTAQQLKAAVKKAEKLGNYTIAVQVPQGYKKAFLELTGLPAGNVQEWEQTVDGAEQARSDTVSSICGYGEILVNGGTSTQSFYADLDRKKLDKQIKKQELVNVNNTYKRLVVTTEEPIKQFVLNNLGKYIQGSAFYQLTKPEKVQSYKQILLVPKKRRATIYAGPKARELLSLPTGQDIRVKPGDHGAYDIFIQSTSVNRKLVRGTTVLVDKRPIQPTASGNRFADGLVS